MKIKKGKYLILALALSILTACNGNTEESSPPKETSTLTEDAVTNETNDTSKDGESSGEESETDNQQVDEKEEAEEVAENDVDKEDKIEEDQEDSEDSTDKEALFEQIKTENDKVRKVIMKSEVQKIEPDTTHILNFDADALYGDDLIAIKADTMTESNDGYRQKVEFNENDNTKAIITERQAGQEETTVTEVTVDNFDLHPDYHRLIQGIMDLKDKLEVKEDGSTIKLKLKEDAEDVLKHIEEEYYLELNLVEEDEVKKTMEIEFDKESKLLKSFYLELDPQLEELEGHKITAESLFTDHDFNNN